MAWKAVDNYWLGYNHVKKQFYFYFHLEGENVVYQIFPAAEEMVPLADMFRNEGPINYNTTGKYFVTAAEEIGEEETAP